MKTNIINFIKKYAIRSIASTLLLALSLQTQILAAMPLLFYVNSFDAEVGDTVSFDLKVNPNGTIYTVGTTLNYDPSLLTFVSATFDKNWMALSRAPYELTDTINGNIQRTAGYPEGATGVTEFVKYKFRAKSAGKAVVTIKEGIAFDADNNDLGVQTKQITVNIGERKQTATTETTATAAKETAKTVEKHVNVTLDLVGATGHSAGSDYNLSAKLKVTDDKDNIVNEAQALNATTTVSLVNKMGQALWSDSKVIATVTNNQSVDFVIPSTVLANGDYDIMADVKYEGQKAPEIASKPIGVLESKTEQIVTTKIPDYLWPLIITLIVLVLVMLAYMLIAKQNRNEKKRK